MPVTVSAVSLKDPVSCIFYCN